MINPKEFQALRKEFNKIDTNGSGTLEIEELRDAVRKAHKTLPEEELSRILHEIDINGKGVINYHEFIAATFSVEKYATRERIASLFTKFDGGENPEDHQISATTLREAFTKLGHNLTDKEVDDIMREHDVDADHEISFNEFAHMVIDNV